MRSSRRTFLRIAGGAAAYNALGDWPSVLPARAEEASWQHGLAIFGDLKYPAGFAHYDYVNPAAPKMGIVRQAVTGTFDNFNIIVAGVKGQLVGGIDLIYETLLAASLDEESSEYGLVAEAVRFPPDRSTVTYRLRAEARWHDGQPITPEDVIFSLESLKENSPQYSAYYQHVKKVERTGERDVTFTFDRGGIRELPQIVGELMVLPKHWFEGKTPTGAKRDAAATTLEPPIGSGPYRIKSFIAGTAIIYERVRDYWGRNLPIRIGQQNFDELHVEYFRDTSVAFEAFKADQYDWHVENTARVWATGYNFPAVQDKRVIKEEFPIRNVGLMQAFAFNIRRAKFRDARLRRAFNFALDFETINAELFFGQYTRINSYFNGTELASSGLPEGLELEMLETVRRDVPPEVFTTPYTNPVGGTDRAARANLLEASKLLAAAGYAVRNLRLLDAKTGQQLAVEFLLPDASYERFVLFYAESLKRLGINVSVRTVDDAQYENRLRHWDFDITLQSWQESLTPGNEQRDYWGSRAADMPGSSNLIGIKNPAIDTLITQVIEAQTREQMTASVHALDRVLLWHHYVVPQWATGTVRSARWDRFDRPGMMPQFGQAAFPDIWWWDATRAAKTAAR